MALLRGPVRTVEREDAGPAERLTSMTVAIPDLDYHASG
jgi:hypothetical protein